MNVANALHTKRGGTALNAVGSGLYGSIEIDLLNISLDRDDGIYVSCWSFAINLCM